MKKIILIITAVMLFSGTAMAAEWNFYGSAQVNTFYTDVDNGGSAAKNLAHGLNAESVIGATVRVSDTLSGMFEYGSENGNANIRYLYGVWNFGAGSLLVGQDDEVLAHPGSEQVYNDNAGLGGWGEMATGKKAQIKLILGDFRLAFRAPDTTYNSSATNTNITTNTEVKLPSIEARYNFSGDNWNLAVNGGYMTYEVGTVNAQDVTSFVVGIGGDFSVGALVLGANIFGGENVGNLVDADVNGGDTGNGYAVYNAVTNKVTDNEAFAWRVTATYAVNDMFSVHGGYGYMSTELDNNSTKDDVKAYYLQTPITLAPGVAIIPEAGVVDYNQTGAANQTTYFGAKWQIDF